jgi:hypothetical protein
MISVPDADLAGAAAHPAELEDFPVCLAIPTGTAPVITNR